MGGHVKTVAVRDRVRAGRGRHRLHRLQRAHLSDVHPAARRTRRRHPAERHVAGVGLPGLRRRVQLARHRRLLRPARRGRSPEPVADDRRHPAVLPRGTRRRWMHRRPRPGPWATSSTMAATARASAATSSSRSRPPSGRPARPGSSTSRSTTCCGSWTTTGSSATATPSSGGRSRAARCAMWTGSWRPAAWRDQSRAARSSDVSRSVAGVMVRTEDGARNGSMRVVMATHADQALDLSPRCRRARADGAGRLRLLDQPGRPPYGRARAADADSAHEPRGTWTRTDCASSGRGAHDDLPHESAAVAGRPDAVLACRSTPAIASDPTGSSWSEP